jgi:hypothetical protein
LFEGFLGRGSLGSGCWDILMLGFDDASAGLPFVDEDLIITAS